MEYIDEKRDSENSIASPGDYPARRVYEPPVLVEWGTILDLTLGAAFGGQDDGFLGTGGI